MTQILLIETDDSLRSILKLNIMKTIGSDVVEKKSAADAISLLEILPSIDLVICREQIGFEKTASKLAGFFENEKRSTPLLVIGKNVSNYKHLVAVDSNQNWETIITFAGKMLGTEVVFDTNNHADEFLPISIDYFLNITSTSFGCDVYIRVKKGDEYQYIKRLYAKDQFTRDDIEKYIAGGLKEFYIPKDHFSQFVNFVTTQLTLKLGDDNLSSPERIKLMTETYNVTLDRIHSLGIDEHIVGLVEESIKTMEKLVKGNNVLNNFLGVLRSKEHSYGYSHSYLCSLILHKIINKFDWYTPQLAEKLTYIAYFHDISLKEHLMSYYNEKDIEKNDLSGEDKASILNHASQSAMIIDKFPDIPTGVGLIIKEHHGSRNGIGFPKTLNVAISPLSMMFIVVEHFVDEFLKLEDNPKIHDVEKIFEVLTRKYNNYTYYQTVIVLHNMILNKKA